MKLKSVNPYTEKINWAYDSFSIEECRARIEKSRAAFSMWSSLPAEEKAKHFKTAAEILRESTDTYAEIITKEMGKPVRQSKNEVQKCAQLCDYYAKNATELLKDEIVDIGTEKSYVTFEPLGVIFGIMPWNFPFWQVFRFAIPAMYAGNVCVLKHASNVPKSALEIENIFLEAGFPENVFNTLLIESKTAMQILKEELVDGVSFTGSTGAGAKIGKLAGKGIKPVVLELGGSDPFIVLEDANIERAAQAAVKSRFLNAGQSCTAAKRLIVVEDIVADFIESFELKVKKLKIGDPMDEENDIGPLAKKEFLESLERVLKDAKKKGVKPHIYGEKHKKGFFFRPTIIPAASTDMEVCRTEVFGPIAPVITVKDEDEAVEIANSTEYGLGAKIWSGNLDRAERLAKRIKSGSVSINGMIKSDPRLPFGGTKKSGIGRELSHYGLKEFVNIKTVVVNR